MTVDPTEVMQKGEGKQRDVEARIRSEMPALREALERNEAPPVTIRCKNEHDIIEVYLASNGGDMWLAATEATGDEDKGTVVDAWEDLVAGVTRETVDYKAITRQRVRFVCREPGCGHKPVVTQARLLKRYAIAFELGNKTITLMD